MKKALASLVAILMLLGSVAFAQSVKLYRDTTVHVFNGGRQLTNAWAGGFNAPCFVEIDLDGDGKMDLAVFDGIDDFTFRINCFLNKGIPGVDTWVYAPQYASSFPSTLSSWLRGYDYDCDGDVDLFSYMNGGGMQVWRNEMNPSGTLQFTLQTTTVNTHYASFATGIYVSRVDMPALSDLDNDGDMDILNFSNAANFLEHHRNYSMDSTGSCSSLSKFYNIWKCWGYFYTLYGMNKAELPPDTSASPLCPLYAASHPFMDLSGILQRTSSSRHSGSATLVVDLDGDGDKDVLLTDISSARLLYIENCGTPDSAYACAQDTLFPSYDVPAQLSSPMGAAYYFDADNDGNKDLIYANFWGTGDDYDNSYFYKNMTNNTTNRFAFQNKRFLGNTMIDVGTSAHPVLYDFDGDGLKDMFIGDDYYSKNYVSKIAYYHNSGTATNPVFNLVTDDFGNLSALSGIAAIYPTFGDLDGDGDPDMLCGENGGGLLYFENVNGTMVFITANYQSIGVGSTAAPQLVDVDRDGKLDLVIGKRNGQLSYFRNTSTTNSPIFTLVTNNFGGVTLDVGFFSAPCLFEHNGTYEMLVGSQSGWLYHYTNIDGNLSGTFTLADSTFQNIYQPTRACPTVADIDGDGKYDLIVGNQEGGVTLYTQNALLNAIHEETAGGSYFTLYPNPASSSLQLLLGQTPSSGRIEIQIFDVLGQQVMNQRSILTNVGIDISELTPGLYLCKVVDGNRSFSQTFIKE